MDSENLIFYFGDDMAYFKAIEGEFKQKTSLQSKFRSFFETDEKKTQSLFLQVFQQHPQIVFIDLSKNSQNYLHLARILARTPSSHPYLLVGLVDYLSSPDILREGIATGVDLVFIKSVEIFDIIFSTTKMLNLFQGHHDFANAKLEEEWEVGVPCKIGYVEPESLHLECDLKLQQNQKIKICHDFNRLKLFPSFEFKIKKITDHNIYYHFHYAVDAEILFQDEVHPLEDELPSQLEKREEKRNDLVELNKKMLLQWIQKNMPNSEEKKAKVLIIDRLFSIYDHQQRSDKTGYTIRCLPTLEKPTEQLQKDSPHIIAYALEDHREEDDGCANDHDDKLSSFFNALKKIQLNSLVIIFNTKLTSREIQNRFQYQQVMATENLFSVKMLRRMAEMLEAKLNKKQTSQEIQPKKKKQIFLGKTNSLSLADILIPINIKSISEIDLSFTSHILIPSQSNLHFTTPVNMYVNCDLVSEQKEFYEYRGFIHAIGEEDKKNLRKFVNSIFFRDHDAKVLAEKEDFKKLNEQKLTEIREKEIEEKEKEKEKEF